MLEMFIIKYTSIWPNFKLIALRIQKKYAKVYYAAMSMITPQILKFVDFTKTQKSRYVEHETLFFLQINILITHQGLLYGQKYFCSGGNL